MAPLVRGPSHEMMIKPNLCLVGFIDFMKEQHAGFKIKKKAPVQVFRGIE
jgi:hypothetical protein